MLEFHKTRSSWKWSHRLRPSHSLEVGVRWLWHFELRYPIEINVTESTLVISAFSDMGIRYLPPCECEGGGKLGMEKPPQEMDANSQRDASVRWGQTRCLFEILLTCVYVFDRWITGTLIRCSWVGGGGWTRTAGMVIMCTLLRFQVVLHWESQVLVSKSCTFNNGWW